MSHLVVQTVEVASSLEVVVTAEVMEVMEVVGVVVTAEVMEVVVTAEVMEAIESSMWSCGIRESIFESNNVLLWCTTAVGNDKTPTS